MQQIDIFFDDLEVNQPLTQAQVRNWFRGVLSEHVIHKTPVATDIQNIRDAIAQGDEYLLVVEEGRLNAVIGVCTLTTNFMKNQLNQPISTQTQ